MRRDTSTQANGPTESRDITQGRDNIAVEHTQEGKVRSQQNEIQSDLNHMQTSVRKSSKSFDPPRVIHKISKEETEKQVLSHAASKCFSVGNYKAAATTRVSARADKQNINAVMIGTTRMQTQQHDRAAPSPQN